MVKSYAAMSKGSELEIFEFEPEDLEPNKVNIIT